MNLLSLIEIVGVIQGIILSLALFTIKHGNFRANRYLAICLTTFSLGMLIHFTDYIPNISLPKHELVINLLSLLYAPLLFLYIKSLTNLTFRLKKILHFLPFFIFLIFTPIIYTTFIKFYNPFLYVMNFILFVQLFIYLTIYILILKEYSIKIKESLSTLDKVNLNWLKTLVTIFSMICFTSLFLDLFINGHWDYIWVMVSILMYTTGYFALWQPEIFKNDVSEKEDNKYKKSSLTNEMLKEHFKKLTQIMDNDKPYLNSNLTLSELARTMKLSTHHLSQIINQKCNQSFFEFINKYRIEKVKELLKDPEYKNKKIIEIGYDAGYNSVSSFNKAFKNITSMTPSAYRNNYFLQK